MPEIADLPHYLAALNAVAAVFLTAGFIYIRRGEKARHRACMLGALAASSAFLVIYLIYHFNAGLAKFGGDGWIRPAYFTLLISHIILAVAIVPLVPITVIRAWRGRFAAHRRIAPWTLWSWLYVSVTGVIVYVMAIHLFPYANG